MAWFLNPALTRFRNEVNARWPRRDKTSDGTIGDAAHAARRSDHNPDRDGSVDAWDMDVDGVDVAACKRAFEAHEAAEYWIHNDQICFRDQGWRPQSYAYAGPTRNRHDKHVHWNSRQSRENSTKPWFTTNIKPLEEDMSLDTTDIANIKNGVAAVLNQRFGFPVDQNAFSGLVAGLAAMEVREVARDAAQTTLIEQVLAAAGNPLSTEQFTQLMATVREAAAQAGAEASAALQERLAAAAQAEADALNDEPAAPDA